jgi:hypothetical protein
MLLCFHKILFEQKKLKPNTHHRKFIISLHQAAQDGIHLTIIETFINKKIEDKKKSHFESRMVERRHIFMQITKTCNTENLSTS